MFQIRVLDAVTARLVPRDLRQAIRFPVSDLDAVAEARVALDECKATVAGVGVLDGVAVVLPCCNEHSGWDSEDQQATD